MNIKSYFYLLSSISNWTILFFVPILLGDYVHQEIEQFGVVNALRNVTPLQRAPFGLFGVVPRAIAQFRDEDLAGFREQSRGLCTDHPHVFIGFHYFFHSGKREEVIFEEVGV